MVITQSKISFWHLGIILLILLMAGSAWGRNKIQYEALHWRVATAENADIYYHQGEEEIAAQAVEIANEFTRKLEAWFSFSFYDRVPIVVYAGHPLFANTNITPYILPEGVAGFTEIIKGRVVLPYSGSRASFRHVLSHELVHAAIRQKLQFLYGHTNRLQGQRPPLWFEEGLAEYLSYGYPATDSAYISELVVGGGLVPLEQMGSISGSYRMYKEGQCLMAWLAEHRGITVFGKLVESGLWNNEFSKGMEAVLGYDLAELNRRWQADLRKKYMPAQAERSLAEDIARSLTKPNNFALGTVSYSRGGKQYLAYISTAQDDLRVVRSELDESGRLTKTKTLLLFGISEKAEDILLLGNHLGASPDGTVLAVPVRSGPGYALLFMDSLSGHIQSRIIFKGFMGLTSPCFSPDGKDVVFTATDPHGQPDIFWANVASKEVKRLTEDVRQESYPGFLNGGKQIIFMGDDGNPLHGELSNLYRYNLETGELTLIKCEYDISGVATSPDGKKIAITNDTPLGTDVLLWDWEEGKQEVIARLAGPALAPAFSSQGDALFLPASHNGFFLLHRLPIPADLPQAKPQVFEPIEPTQLQQNSTTQLAEKSKNYHPQYSLDILQSEIAFGPEVSTSLGAIVALTDTFSDRRYSFILGSSAQSSEDLLSGLSIGAAYTDLSARLGWEVAAFRFVESSNLWEERLYDETRSGAELAFSYPLNSMMKFDLDLVAWYDQRISYYTEYIDKESFTRTIKRNMMVGGSYLSFTNDNSLWQIDGPIDGSLYGLTVGGTRSLSQGNMLYLSLFPDYRTYLRLGKAEALAFRLVSWQTFGHDALPFRFGGSLSMRGWNWLDFRGTRMAMGNAELRFNLADQVIADTMIGELGAMPLRGALFCDVGEAWYNIFPDHFRGDAGFGFRWALAGVLVLRFDWAKRATIFYGDAVSQKKSRWLDFKPGFPFQFFVGWSY